MHLDVNICLGFREYKILFIFLLTKSFNTIEISILNFFLNSTIFYFIMQLFWTDEGLDLEMNFQT